MTVVDILKAKDNLLMSYALGQSLLPTSVYDVVTHPLLLSMYCNLIDETCALEFLFLVCALFI